MAKLCDYVGFCQLNFKNHAITGRKTRLDREIVERGRRHEEIAVGYFVVSFDFDSRYADH
jgi:hypothetical protein